MANGDMQRAVGDVLKRVLMVPPTHFTVEYTINPWMGGVVDKAKAHEQWSKLKGAIEKEGVKSPAGVPSKNVPTNLKSEWLKPLTT
ncbi:hypothetical protein L596_000648 [Steinernema carpocapsae]|uniref:Uncharacterized protein n=1 Tax=Steinernema carpocapsae TaxID=34508 RepID=A0A4U8UK18_STECR|nr:hypothetical protein L596_000648 [Steinernema carpocapsae]